MNRFLATITATAILAFAAPAIAAPTVGQPAPDFSATDVNGKAVKLSDLKGKIVVLEWTNNECPYVKKHYGSGNMQKTQKEAAAKGVEWITVNSSAPGRQGHVSAEEAKKIMTDAGGAPSAEILDEDGKIGKAYDAKTTPHMFVIDKEGTLVYAGAIDDNPSPKPEDAAAAKNYVLAALSDIEAGKPVETPTSQPYGCAVKYAD
ncbi:MAG: thioredoxin family protein [Alphaproteobacteria bacterium PRO2]|nr:thioredoxin family protein [Alphaproteobacteria bacterium PRO2]